MVVYVDPIVPCAPNEKWKWNKSCHLTADTVEELHKFASRLGLKRAYFQGHDKNPRHWHYDLTESMREKAVLFGAVEITWQQAGDKFLGKVEAVLDVVPGSLAMFGYSDRKTEHELQCALVANKEAIIVDTRYRPACNWSPLWTQSGLENRYGDRYIYRGNWLGNLNYNNDDPIKLANEKAGIDWLVSELKEGKTLILLCACKEENICHRKTIYDKVKAILGDRFPSFQLEQRVMTPYGVGTIDPHVPLNVHRARNRYGVKLDMPTLKPRYYSPHELQPYSVVQKTLSA